MHIADYILLIGIGVCFGAALHSMYRTAKKGGCTGCLGSCSGCKIECQKKKRKK